MKYAIISDGKLYIEDDRWVTIRGNHVLIKGDNVQDDFDVGKINTSDPDEIVLRDVKGNETVVKRGKPMTFKEADTKKPNPLYDTGWKYDQNCQVCVIAYEMRLRGFDVEATGFSQSSPEIQKLEMNPSKIFGGLVGNMVPYPAKDEETKWFSRLGQYKTLYNMIKSGERYHIEIVWKNDQAHVATITKQKGRLVLYDPQSGNIYKGAKQLRDGILKNVSYVSTYRVDDKEIDMEMASRVLKKAGSGK